MQMPTLIRQSMNTWTFAAVAVSSAQRVGIKDPITPERSVDYEANVSQADSSEMGDAEAQS